MGVILFLIANVSVLVTAIILSRKLKLRFTSDNILSVIVLGFCQVILTEMALGLVFKRLFAGELLIINLIILGIVILWNGQLRLTLRELQSAAVRYKEKFFKLEKPVLLYVLAGIALVEVIYVIFVGLNYSLFGYDGLAYHLPQVAFWYQNGYISHIPASINNAWFWGNVYPINSELLSLWSAIFIGNDALVDLVQLPFAIFGAAAVYSLARKIHIGFENSVIAALLFLITPIVIVQSISAYIDVIFGSLVIISINFFMGYYKTRRRNYLFLLALSLGLLLGIKSSGLAFSAVLVIAAFLVYLFCAKQTSFKGILKFSLLFGAAFLVLGSFAYLRNLHFYGNPIYPFEVKVSGYEVFKGKGSVKDLIMTPNTPAEYRYTSNLMRVLRTWIEELPDYTYDTTRAGFGPIWVVLGLPSIIFLIMVSVKNKLKPEALMTGSFLVLFIMQPSNWWTRYTLFFTALGVIAIAYLLEFSTQGIKQTIKYLCVPLAVYTAVNVFIYIPVNMLVEKDRVKDYTWVQSVKQGSRIGVASTEFMYPLFGGNFKNSVQIFEHGKKDITADELATVDYITYLKSQKDIEGFVLSNPGKIKPYFEGKDTVVYKVINGGN